jgi:tetratricopeptide (TPR) repeat protein
LAVFSVLIGVFALSARGAFFLPSTESGASVAAVESLQAEADRPRQVVTLPARPTAAPASATQAVALPTPSVASTPETVVSDNTSALLPTSALLNGLRHEYQGWNNCAPSSVGMVLSYFNRTEQQAEIAPYLKPDPNDKNVSPHEIAAYAQAIGFGAHIGVGGDMHLLKQFLSAGFPVIAEIWFVPEPDDGMGHYRVLFGYDDQTETFSAHDSYVGPNLSLSYAELDAVWRVFNRTYVVIYPAEKESTVQEILSESGEGEQMWQRAFRIAQEELLEDRENAFAWFNLGTSALQLGDTQQAAEAFDWARHLGLPWRMFWYQFGPFEAYMAQGRYQDVIALAEAGMDDAAIEEWYYWRGRALEMTGDVAGAQTDYRSAIELNANYTAARDALEKSQAA